MAPAKCSLLGGVDPVFAGAMASALPIALRAERSTEAATKSRELSASVKAARRRAWSGVVSIPAPYGAGARNIAPVPAPQQAPSDVTARKSAAHSLARWMATR